MKGKKVRKEGQTCRNGQQSILSKGPSSLSFLHHFLTSRKLIPVSPHPGPSSSTPSLPYSFRPSSEPYLYRKLRACGLPSALLV